jgi:transposase InsO family protein
MQSVSMDLYEVRGRHFLVMVDRYLYFCWTAQLQSQTSSTVIKIIDNWFRGVGYPQYVFSDSGPQFAVAEFKEYCKKHHITPLVSSACYPMSNGLAESSVKTVKYLLLKSDSYIDFEKRLYELQNIPSAGDIVTYQKKIQKKI